MGRAGRLTPSSERLFSLFASASTVPPSPSLEDRPAGANTPRGFDPPSPPPPPQNLEALPSTTLRNAPALLRRPEPSRNACSMRRSHDNFTQTKSSPPSPPPEPHEQDSANRSAGAIAYREPQTTLHEGVLAETRTRGFVPPVERGKPFTGNRETARDGRTQ